MPVAFLDLAGATAQFMTLAAPPLSPTHRTGSLAGFGGRLSDNLCVSFAITGKHNKSVMQIKY